MIRVTADSTCDLPTDLLAQYNIAITPLGVVKGDGLFHDNVDITTRDIVAHVASGGDITTTNAVNIADYYAFFQKEKEGYEGLLHVNLGAGFSSCYQNATLAATEFDTVVAIDSENLSVGHGLLVIAAAKAAQAGASMAELIALVEDLRPRVETSFVLETLDYMKKGGRCSAVTALGANLLKLRPCIEVADGKMVVTKKYRGTMEKVMATYIKERLDGRDDIATSILYLADSCDSKAHPIIQAANSAMTELGITPTPCDIGCTVLCHCGPNTVGFTFIRQ